MKVFVAGGTGVVGRRAVAALVAAGHDVTVVTRSPEKAALVAELGARPVTVDVFDPAAVASAVHGHDAVCNLSTHIPSLSAAGARSAWEENHRIRREASRNLVDAAMATGATRYVQESIAFTYVDGGDRWLDEDSARELDPATASTADAEGHALRFTEAGGAGVVLRFGLFYAPDAVHTRDMLRLARLGLDPSVGRAGAFSSSIHADDAAAAVVAALAAPAGVYNVVDDDPVRRRDASAALAAALGKRRLWRLPARLARLAPSKASLLSRSQRVSNRRFRDATGWRPSVPSVRDGWPAVVAGAGGEHRPRPVRVPLALLALTAAMVGGWAQFAPRSFYDSFPGGGRAWVSADGPFNEHLVRDVGGLNLALAVLTVAALVAATTALARTAAVAWLAYGVPHLVYHAAHLDLYATGDKVANMVSLGGGVLLALLVLALSRPHLRPRSRTRPRPAPTPAERPLRSRAAG